MRAAAFILFLLAVHALIGGNASAVMDGDGVSAGDLLCRKYAPSNAKAETLKYSHCQTITSNALRELCEDIVGSSGYGASGEGQWSGALKAISASKDSGAYGKHGVFFYQFCVNPSTPSSNPTDVICDIPDEYGAPTPTPTPSPQPSAPQDIPGYEIFVVETITGKVEKWGDPGTTEWGNPTCQMIHCFSFDQYGPVDGKKHQLLWTFDPVCYDMEQQCVDKDRPVMLKCSEIAEYVEDLTFDRPTCKDAQSMPSLGCNSNCVCKDVWGCENHLASPEEHLFIAQTDPTGKPRGHILLTQHGSLNTHCGKMKSTSQLQGYMNPSWSADNYYGGLPAWLTAILCLALGGMFFGAWVLFFWSARKKANRFDAADDGSKDSSKEQEEHRPFIYNLPPNRVKYCCTHCMEEIPNLTDYRFCPGCSRLLEDVLVVDPSSTSSGRIRQIYAESKRGGDRRLSDGLTPA